MSNLYDLQEKIWNHVFQHEKQLGISNTLLCGGTALARFYLNHRISYDLDFFVPSKFSPEALHSELKSIGIDMVDPIMEGGRQYCCQLKGLVRVLDEAVKIEFIEDIYEGMFDVVIKGAARTESIDGLYHRKIRTVSGVFLKDGSIHDGRQTARDIFDLYVLGQSIESLSDFVGRINEHGTNVPLDGIRQGILSMPWLDLVDEFDELERTEPWQDCALPDIKRYLEYEIKELQKLKELDNKHDSTFRL